MEKFLTNTKNFNIFLFTMISIIAVVAVIALVVSILNSKDKQDIDDSVKTLDNRMENNNKQQNATLNNVTTNFEVMQKDIKNINEKISNLEQLNQPPAQPAF